MPDGVEVYQDDSGRVTVYVQPSASLVQSALDMRSGQVAELEHLQYIAEQQGLSYQMLIVLLGVLLAYIITRR